MCSWMLDDCVARSGLTLLPIGSSRGRGTRGAAWFADQIKKQSDDTMQSLVLEGGIKGWVVAGGEFLQYVQGYDESKW